MVHDSHSFSNVAHIYVFISVIQVDTLACLLEITFFILVSGLLSTPIICSILLTHLPSSVNIVSEYSNLLTYWIKAVPILMIQVDEPPLDVTMHLHPLPHLFTNSIDALDYHLKLIFGTRNQHGIVNLSDILFISCPPTLMLSMSAIPLMMLFA